MATVLVVDDEAIVRKFVCTMLRKEGHRCLEAANGFEAVAVFKSNVSVIDLVITDLRMPVMNGAEAVARMRETKPDLRVICMTGYTEDPVPRDTILVTKPFKFPILHAALDRLLRR